MTKPTLILNPYTDEELAWRTRELLSEGVSTPAGLEAALRDRYPRIVVRERGLHAEAPTWYVYREGQWVPSAD